jgi:hypothetical protein
MKNGTAISSHPRFSKGTGMFYLNGQWLFYFSFFIFHLYFTFFIFHLIGVQCSANIFTTPLCFTMVMLHRCLSLNCSPW